MHELWNRLVRHPGLGGGICHGPRRDVCKPVIWTGLKRDKIRTNHHRALGYCLSMIFSENRFALFRILL
jgi:hypothetical protein